MLPTSIIWNYTRLFLLALGFKTFFFQKAVQNNNHNMLLQCFRKQGPCSFTWIFLALASSLWYNSFTLNSSHGEILTRWWWWTAFFLYTVITSGLWVQIPVLPQRQCMTLKSQLLSSILGLDSVAILNWLDKKNCLVERINVKLSVQYLVL